MTSPFIFSPEIHFPTINVFSKESAGMAVQGQSCCSEIPVHGAVCSAR